MADRTRDAWLVVRSDELVDRERSPRFLTLRSATVRLEDADGNLTDEGTWDFVERPAGLDAVIVVVYRRAPNGVEVLLRRGLRVPTIIGVEGRGVGRHPATFVEELVAGLVERGDDPRERARLEVAEETGIDLSLSVVEPLDGPLWATPGLLAEVLHWFAADATGVEIREPDGDGSVFEALSSIAWYPLDEAIERVSTAAVGPGDLRAELGLRRLAARLAR